MEGKRLEKLELSA